ncbi:miz zinc finger protein [Moniliophthora roreri]|nr:miz zinc finger protein [Moniliophthora roreri]
MPSIISTAAFALLALSAAVSAVPHAACTDGRPSLSGTNDGQDLAFSVFKDTAVNVNAPGGNGQGLAGAFDGTKVSFAKFPKWKRSSNPTLAGHMRRLRYYFCHSLYRQSKKHC